MLRFCPTISVIVPCYNAAATIERSLNSILTQTIPVTEILVYDDCSQDQSPKILAQMAKDNIKINVFTGMENKGAGHARNVLLKEARGDIFAFLDSDDVWHPQKLEAQLELMQRQRADIVVCNYDIVTDTGEKIGTRELSSSITRFKMHLRNEIPTSMAILHSNLIGCRDMQAIRRRQDYAYWLSLFYQNEDLLCVVVPKVLGTYYKTPGSLSSNMITNIKANYTMFREVMQYPVFLSGLCVLSNIITRVIRV